MKSKHILFILIPNQINFNNKMKFIITIVLVCILYIHIINAKKEEKVYPILKADLPFISCDVCTKAINNIWNLVNYAKRNIKKFEEIIIVDSIENTCNPKNLTSGKWIRLQDIAEEKTSGGKYLRLIETDGQSVCEEECNTIAKSCQLLFDEELDDYDLSTIIWKNQETLESLQQKVCQKWTSRCKKDTGKPKYLPAKFKREDYPFITMTQKEIEMEELMTQMHEAGLGDGMDVMDKASMSHMMDERYGDSYEDEDIEDNDMSDSDSSYSEF